MLFHYPLRRIRHKFFPEPLPSANSFSGQTVLVTGATAGLGLAAAIHFATLGATVIITSRKKSNGESARGKIEKNAGIIGERKVHVMELDLDRYSSCVAFVGELKKWRGESGALDCVVLNAGGVNPNFVESPEGWEQTIQVNTLSTVLLGLLLLPWMKQEQTHRKTSPHLVFVTSRAHLDPDITNWAQWSKEEGILRHFSKKENWPPRVLRPNYDTSKLMLTYAVEEMCKQALGPDGIPKVILNTVCPGLVHTDIGREVTRQSLLMQVFVPLWLGSLGKSADYGARTYVAGCLASEDEHGKFLQSLYSEDEYRSMALQNLESDMGKEVQVLVWKEILGELTTKIPALQNSTVE